MSLSLWWNTVWSTKKSGSCLQCHGYHFPSTLWLQLKYICSANLLYGPTGIPIQINTLSLGSWTYTRACPGTYFALFCTYAIFPLYIAQSLDEIVCCTSRTNTCTSIQSRLPWRFHHSTGGWCCPRLWLLASPWFLLSGIWGFGTPFQ